MGLCNHVVHIDLNFFMNHVVKQCHHGSLIGCPSILQPKRHDLVTKGAPRSNECCLFHVLGCHLYLIVTRKTIYEGENRELSSAVYQYINVRKREIILWA